MRINQNIAAFNAYRNLSTTQNSLGKSLEKLSSGFRINRAADDAAGLTKSEGLRAEIRGTNQAIRNAQDGVSLVQTAEGALNEVHSILQRMRELAVGAANTATTDGAAQQAEVDQLLEELTAIGEKTYFSGQQVFNGEDRTFQVGARSGAQDQLTVTFASLAADDVFGVDLSGVALAGTPASADYDPDPAGDGSLPAVGTPATAGDPSAAIALLDDAIASVSSERSTLGAKQNRLEHTIANLQVATENLSASESRIRDADMAQEMVTFTRNQILQQAGTAMLAQANQVPQSVLSLLR